MKSRPAWSDLQAVQDVRLEGGSRVEEEDREEQNDNPDPMGAITRLGEQFKVLLQSAGTDLDVLTEVFKKMLLLCPPNPIHSPAWITWQFGGGSFILPVLHNVQIY